MQMMQQQRQQQPHRSQHERFPSNSIGHEPQIS